MKSITFLYNNVEMNLCSDMKNIAASLLIKQGYDAKKVAHLSNPLKTFFEHDMLRISVRKRKIIYSNEFRCPSICKKALDFITKKIERGEDINPFLSKRQDRADAKDELLFDWGIYHLHLVDTYDGIGRSKRSKYLLFFRCDDSVMYFIQIYKHNPAPFAKGELQRIVIHNWPHLLAPVAPIEGSLTEPITDDVRKVLRKKHGMSFFELDGKLYFPPGGGYMSDGSSLFAVRHADYCWNSVKLFEKRLLLNISAIRKAIDELIYSDIAKDDLKFKLLQVNLTKLIVCEMSNLIKIEYEIQSHMCRVELFLYPDKEAVYLYLSE